MFEVGGVAVPLSGTATGASGCLPRADGLPMVADICCRTEPRGTGKPHAVIVRPDWTVDTGHDLAAERVAVAFGGYLSCLDLVDRTVPAFRDALPLWTRQRLPAISRAAGGWQPARRPGGCGCVRSRRFRTAAAAAAHERSADHQARLHGCDVRDLGALLAAASAAHGDLHRPPDSAVRALVREPFGLAELWAAGISPGLVADAHRRLWPGDEPLPARFYLAVCLLGPSEEFLAAVIGAGGDPDVATWAAWTEQPADREQPTARARWLSLGLPRLEVERLVGSGYAPDDVRRLAEATRRPPRQVAHGLYLWTRAGCHPTVADLARLHALAVDDRWVPAAAAIDRLAAEVRTEAGAATRADARPPSRTDLALLLAVAGTVPAARDLVRSGVPDLQTAARRLTAKGPR